jgi:hypothetical protein
MYGSKSESKETKISYVIEFCEENKINFIYRTIEY